MSACRVLAVVAAMVVSGCATGSTTQGQAPATTKAARGLAVDLAVEPQAAGEGAVIVRVEVSDDDGGGPGYVVDFGDGTSERSTLAMPACPPGEPSDTPPRSLRTELAFPHKYESSGEFTVTVRVISARYCTGTAVETAGATVRHQLR